jgi:hypothetical protein
MKQSINNHIQAADEYSTVPDTAGYLTSVLGTVSEHYQKPDYFIL